MYVKTDEVSRIPRSLFGTHPPLFIFRYGGVELREFALVKFPLHADQLWSQPSLQPIGKPELFLGVKAAEA
jgi:hypothetical protein